MPSSRTRGAATASSLPHPQVVEDLASLPARGRAGDEVDRHQRIEAVDRVVRGAHGLGEHQRAVGALDRGREAAEELVLAGRLRDDLAPLGERVEVLARGTAVGTGVAFGEVRDRGEEVAEGFEGHVAHAAEVKPRADEPLLDRGVLGALADRERYADERDAGSRAHAVGDRLLEAVAVADAAEVGQQQIGHRVVAALEGRGEPEPFLVLGEQRAAQDPAAEAVTLVRDEEPTVVVGRERLVRGSRMTGRDEHVARGRDVFAAVAQSPDATLGHRFRQPHVPLLHQHARRNDHEHEPTAAQRVGRGGDRDVGLAGAGDGLDHATTAAAQPRDERVELPTVELVLCRGRAGEHPQRRRRADMERQRYRAWRPSLDARLRGSGGSTTVTAWNCRFSKRSVKRCAEWRRPSWAPITSARTATASRCGSGRRLHPESTTRRRSSGPMPTGRRRSSRSRSGFHTEYPNVDENEAVIAHLLANERRWRRTVGKEAKVGDFLGRADRWRRVSETWPDPDLGDGTLVIELATRLTDYISALGTGAPRVPEIGPGPPRRASVGQA